MPILSGLERNQALSMIFVLVWLISITYLKVSMLLCNVRDCLPFQPALYYTQPMNNYG